MLNTNENVQIRVTGAPEKLGLFLVSLREEAPPASLIEDISTREAEPEFFDGFNILHSHNVSNDITEISPDIAVCDDCLHDIGQPGPRLDYPFVNCTNCGPRFTIIRDLPYDRAKTTMEKFVMCNDCQNEYESVIDRRFHAQPTACATCGPHYELHVKGNMISSGIDDIVEHISGCIEKGGIALIKGLGGMHLACDAFNDNAVQTLRAVKNRDAKPFAVMFRDLGAVKNYTMPDATEAKSLVSWRRPIVLLAMNPDSNPHLSNRVNTGLSLIGVMLPYMPLHYQLFQRLKTPAIVLTSGNFSNEPILTGNDLALAGFTPFVDAIVLHNREIFNRTDDSVVRIIGGKERVFRRSRGYAPAPVRTSMNTDGILAFGAELTNCFCIGKGQKAFLSQHIGDLQGLETTQFYEETIAQFLKLFRVKPSLLAVDMHPAYISTKTARLFDGLPVISVQHHHGHIASCMAEHHLDEKVIGVAFDGTGYGDDGHSWGSEFMVCDLFDYTRITHFEYIPMPGGDMTTEEPWRMAVSYLFKVFGHSFTDLPLPFLNRLDPDKVAMVIRIMERKINCPLTSGAGRLFDAVASLLDLCHTASFQSEGPMRLESIVLENCTESYPFEAGRTIRFDAAIKGIVTDLMTGTSVQKIATKFHNTIISVIFDSANTIRMREGISKVVLSGGVFQNKYLLEGALALLKKHDFEVYTHEAIPSNDGGIALGQLAVASKRREHSCV